MFLFESQSSRQRSTPSLPSICNSLGFPVTCARSSVRSSRSRAALRQQLALARASRCSSGVQLAGASSSGNATRSIRWNDSRISTLDQPRSRDLTPESGIQYPREVRGFGRGSMGMTDANIAFAQSPPGIGRKRPSLPGQPLGDPASGVPFGCRKCVPLAQKTSSGESQWRSFMCRGFC